jgi:ankyrin repeat protein
MKRIASIAALLLAIAGPGFAQSVDTRLIEAARSGDADAVRSLLASGADVNAAGGDGLTALHAAASRWRALMIFSRP